MSYLKLLCLIFMLSMGLILLSGCTNSKVEKLCDTIESGDTEKAIELAEEMNNYDQYVMKQHLIGIVSILTQGDGVDARTPLITASTEGNYEMMKYLLENGADPNFGKKAATYPLVAYCDYAAGGEEDGVELLLSYGADPNLTVYGYAINHLIRKMFVLKRNEEGVITDTVDEKDQEQYNMLRKQVRQLIDADSVVLEESKKVENRYYSNILEYLVKLNETEIVKLLFEDEKLLECINVQNEEGYTPLMVAAENGHIELCELLLEYDAEVSIVNDNNQTAYDLAIENGNEDVARLLDK